MKTFNRSSQFKDSPFKALRQLRTQCVKLEKISVRLRKRDESLFELCTRAIESEERERAKIYAKELAQVRTTINTVYKSELAIEYITIKLENLIGVLENMVIISYLINMEIKNRVYGIMVMLWKKLMKIASLCLIMMFTINLILKIKGRESLKLLSIKIQ